MADIALLVAEEFEKRKSLMKRDGGKEMVGFDCLASSTLSQLGEKIGEEISFLKEAAAKEIEIARSMMEPKSTLGLAAFDGFFSA